MVLLSLKSQTQTNCFNHINTNQPIQMTDVNYVLIPFEGDTKYGDPMGLKLYLQATNDIDKETYRLDIPVYITKSLDYTTSQTRKKGQVTSQKMV